MLTQVYSYPFAAVLALAVAVLVARWPVGASLGTYAFLLPFDSILIPGQMGGIHLHLTWFVGAAAGGILLTLGLVGRGFVRPPRAALWLSLIVFWAGMSSLWAINTENAVFRLPLVGLLLLLYLAAVSIRVSQQELAMVACLTILGGCIAAAVSLYGYSHGQWWMLPGVHRQLSGRETLSLGERVTNPNTLGATLILPLSLAVGLLLSSRTWLRRLLLTGVVAVIGASIYATMSRGTLVATAVVFLIYLWRSRERWRVLVPITVLGGMVLAMPQLFFLRLGETFADRGAGRFDLWVVGFHILKHYAVLGAGLDCFPDAFNEYVHTAPNFEGFSRAPHNVYLGTWVELGLVGLVLLLSAIGGHLLLAAKASRADSDESSRLRLISYEAACLGLLASGLFLDMLWEEYFWLTLMLLVMAVRARQGSRKAVYAGSLPGRYPFPVAAPLNPTTRLVESRLGRMTHPSPWY
jgi:O-antigen ligase